MMTMMTMMTKVMTMTMMTKVMVTMMMIVEEGYVRVVRVHMNSEPASLAKHNQTAKTQPAHSNTNTNTNANNKPKRRRG